MLKINDVSRLYLGCQGENQAQTITIDVSDWLVDFPSGVVSIWHKRNGDSVPSPTGATLDRESGTISWTPTNTDTYVSGEGEAEVRLTESNVIKKSRKIVTGVSPAVTGAGTPLGSGWQDYIDLIEGYKDAAEDAQEAAEDAQEAAEDAQDAAEDAQEAAEGAQAAAEAARDAAQAAAGDFQGLTATVTELEADDDPTIEVTHSEGGLYNLAFGVVPGTTFTPSVDSDGDISWTNDGGKTNPTTVNIKGPQGNPAPAEQVQPAVNAYLAQVITNPDSPPLDRTLTQSNAATPADLTGKLKSALDYIETLDNVPSDMCVTPIVSYATGFINTSGAVKSNSSYKYARYDILPTTKSILIHRIYIAGSSSSYNVVSAYKNDGTYISGLTNVAAGGTGAFKTYVQFEIPNGTAYILVTSGNMSSSSTFYNVYQIGYYTFVKNERVLNIIPMSTFVEQLYFYVPVSSLESTEYFTLDMELEIDSTRQVASYDVYMCGYNEEMTTRTLGLYRTSLTRFISGNKINLHQNMWDGTENFSSCYYVGFIINLNYTAPSNSDANLGVQTAVNYTVKTNYAYINDVAVTDVGYPEATLRSQVNVAKNEPYNPMYGGRLCTIGDSLTAVYYKTEAESWPYLIAKWNNMSLDNLGVSGRPLAYSEDYSGTCMAEMVDSLNRMKYYTHIFVMGGANDYNYLIPIGNNTDTEITTFKGAVNHMISKLTELYPCARIVFATTYQRTNGKADKPYADAMLEVCNLRGIPCLNNYQASGVQMTSSNWMAVYGADGTTGNKHLNAAGDLFVAPRFESALKYLQGNVQPETKPEYITPDVFFTSKIASLNFTNTSNGRRMDVVGNKIIQTKVGSGSTYGFYSLVGKYYFMSGDATSHGGMDAVVKSMYTNEAYYGFTGNLFSTNYEWLYKQYVYDPKGMSPQMIIATYDPVNDVVLSRTLTTARIAHLTNEFVTAVNTNKNLIVMFYRRLSGDASNGESVEIVWSLEAVEGAT